MPVIRTIVFTVLWDAGRQAFVIRDEVGFALGHSPDRRTALALAIKDAELAERGGARVSILTKGPGGKIRCEWGHLASSA